jgi:ribose/xylose/arabinose/galactoside ABC-type transport system permease subunit
MTRTEIAQLLLRGRAILALVVLVIVFAILLPGFLQFGNLEILAKQTALNAILAIGMTFVILTGGIDLSVGSVVGLTAMLAGLLINEGLAAGPLGVIVYPHTWMVLVISLAAGALVGAVNGFIITRFNVAPFISTLGMLYVARGLAGLINNGNTFPNLVGREELGNTGFRELGTGEFLGLSWAIWIMIAFAVVAWFVTTRTSFGRAVYAVGGNERAAELSGVRVKRTKMIVYMISGFCAATVGLIIASQLVAAHPDTGVFFELNAIAAVVLGGTSLAGGRGTIVGTLIGAFVIGVLTVGLNQLGVSSFWQQVIKGVVIVVALIIDQLQQRAERRLALQQQEEQMTHGDSTPPPTSTESNA